MNIFNKDFTERLKLLNERFTKIAEEKKLDIQSQRLISSLKLSEEVGELSEAVLLDLGHQRKSKLDKYSRDDLDGEVADVLIQTLYIAHLFDINISKVVLEKIEKVENKFSHY